MKDAKIKKLVYAALFSALVCVATMVIKIPTPTNGYVNLGDCIVLLSGWMLGPVYGFLAAGIGSMLADILSGYMYYAPATFLIKGLVALTGSLLFVLFQKALKNHRRVSLILSGILAEAVMIIGYFGFEATFMGYGLAAAASIPGNCVQGTFGVAAGIILMEIIYKTHIIDLFVGKKAETL